MKKSYILFLIFLITTSFGAGSALEYYQAGKKALIKRDYYKATDYFKKSLKKNPYFKKAYQGAGDAYYRLGNYLEARKYYEKVLNYDPEDVDSMLKLADIKIRTSNSPKEYLGAEYYLLKAYQKKPRDYRVLSAYGDYFYALGKYERALNFYEKARRNSNSFLAYLKIHRIYMKWGNHEKAYSYLIKAENLNSTDYRTTFALGKFYLKRKNFPRAKKYLELTLKFYPEFREGLYKIVEFYMLQEGFSHAIKKINELLKLEPENSIHYYNMGYCYEMLNRYQEAIFFLIKGQKYDFSDEILRFKAEEIAALNLPLGHRLRKRLSRFYMQYGTNAYQKNLINHAILSFKRGLRINPLSIAIRKKLAQIYREKGWMDLYLRTLKAGSFVDKKNQELKDLIALNKKFLWDTLAYEKKIDQYRLKRYLPVVYIADVIKDSESRHFAFKKEMKELVIEGLINTHSVNVKEVKKRSIKQLPKQNNLLLRVDFYEDARKIELKAELISLASGNIFKKYFIRRYGNNRIFNTILQFSKQVAKDVVPFGRIISINDDIALINIGKLQNIKKNDRFAILKSRDVIDSYYSDNKFRKFFKIHSRTIVDTHYSDTTFKKYYIIGEAKVIRVDERIAEVRLFKSHSVVFNLININNIVMVKKENVKKKKNQ